MRRTGALRAPIVRIVNGTFHHDTQPIFRDLSLTIQPTEKWSILSKSSSARTALLQILRGQHVCTPPTARSFPLLSTLQDQRLRNAHNAIHYVGFDAERGKGVMRGGYLSARYESLREETDFSLADFLMGNTELNADERLARHPDPALLAKVMADLKLQELADMPVTHLSNGQTRRAKIAKALLSKPELLLLDGPFMGLDPPTLKHLSQLLGDMAEKQAPRLVLSLKPDEHIPDWITHMAFVTQQRQLAKAGPRNDVIQFIHDRWDELKLLDRTSNSRPLNEESIEYAEVSRHLWAHTPSNRSYEDRREEMAYQRQWRVAKEGAPPKPSGVGKEVISRDGFRVETPTPKAGEAVIEMDGVKVQYGDKAVLGNWMQHIDGSAKQGLTWTVRRGQRWGVFGPNGSGKTTLISLITSDHPQTYALPVRLFGRSRLPQPGQPGISIFDLQKRIGHSSPEVHVFFPKHLSLRRTIESAWADTPLTKPKLSFDIDEKVNAALMWFRAELVPSLGPPKWMRAEMDRAVPGVDTGFFELDRAPQNPEKAAYHLRQAEQVIIQEQQEMDSDTWPDDIKFGELSFSAQRVALFIRAVIRNPDLVVLDEAFSGMDDFARDKCQLFLSQGENAIFHLKRFGGPIDTPKITQSDLGRLGFAKIHGLQDSQALIIISHKKEEVPGCVRDWICLPESGTGAPRIGKLDMPLELGAAQWSEIWGEKVGNRRKRGEHGWMTSSDLPVETKEQREARLARKRALMEEVLDVSESEETPKSKAGAARRGPRDHEAVNRRRRLNSKLHREAETIEESERRRAKLRARWHARLESMSDEERLEFSRERNARYFADRPDRLERKKELSRQARIRWSAKLSDDERAAINEKARLRRVEKVAAMSPEQKEAARIKRREKHLERMADPEFAAKWRVAHAERMKKMRLKKKAAQIESGGAV